VSFEAEELPILDPLLQFSDLLLCQDALRRSGVFVDDLLEIGKCALEVSGLLDAAGHAQTLVGKGSGINTFSRRHLPHLRFLGATSNSPSARRGPGISLFEFESPRVHTTRNT
jgi:hypothetical protein